MKHSNSRRCARCLCATKRWEYRDGRVRCHRCILETMDEGERALLFVYGTDPVKANADFWDPHGLVHERNPQ
jgi:hypothetical protein